MQLKQYYDVLLTKAQHWGFEDVLRRAPVKRSALVADKEAFVALSGRGKGYAWPCLTEEEALTEQAAESLDHILVLKRAGEAALIRRLKERFPQAVIQSVLYDLAPRQRLRLAPFPDVAKEQKRHQKPQFPYYLLVSAAGSDAEYFSDVMQAAGLPVAYEYMLPGHEFHAGITRVKPVKRLLTSAAKTAAGRGKYGLHLQADVLLSLMRRGLVDADYWTQKIQASQMKIIYVVRRDLFFQCDALSVVEKTAYRSGWDILKCPADAEKYSKSQGTLPYASLFHLMDQDRLLERWMTQFQGQVKMITLEDLAKNAADVVEDVARFMGLKARASAELPSYGYVYRQVPHMIERQRQFRRDVIDRLGLHMNMYGSFESPGEASLK